MKKERFRLVPFVSLIIRKNNEVLLLRRYNTGYDDGLYHCAGGGVDGNEPITSAAIRELNEELGIITKKENLKVVHTLHYNSSNGEYVNFFLETSEWEGNPEIMEPNKCDDISWFSADSLPENTMSSVKHVIEFVNKNIFYSELGW